MTTQLLATDKQFTFIKKLIEERELTEHQLLLVDDARRAAVSNTLTRKTASAVIDVLVKAPKKETIRPDAPMYSQITDGMYINDRSGRIFKVQHAVHGSGNQYAKELIEGRFEYVRGAIQFVRQECRRMTLEDAKAYGAVYGTCCVCSRTLTNEDSIEAGIGPVCAGRL